MIYFCTDFSILFAQDLFLHSSSFHFSFLSLYFYLAVICVCVIFLFPWKLYFNTFYGCFFVSIFHFRVMFGSAFFRSLSLASSISLLILFCTLTFLFFFHYSFLSFRAASSMISPSPSSPIDSSSAIVKRTLLSCLYNTSVYFERIVITPTTIASLHCLPESKGRASVQSLFLRGEIFQRHLGSWGRSRGKVCNP